MLGKLIRDVAEAAGEVVAAPLTIVNASTKAFEREIDRAASDDKKPKD